MWSEPGESQQAMQSPALSPLEASHHEARCLHLNPRCCLGTRCCFLSFRFLHLPLVASEVRRGIIEGPEVRVRSDCFTAGSELVA